LDLLSSLVDKSLVTKEDAKGRACYRMHETMREYTSLKLHEAGEQDAVERKCADYYVAICRQFAQQNRYRLLEWLEWMELEVDNIRSVLQRCLIHRDLLKGIDLACSLGWYWATRATTEGVRWLDELLAAAPSGGGNATLNGWAYFIRGFLAVLQSDPAAARPALERGILGSRAAGNLPLLSHALSMASVAANMAGDHAAAKRLLDESHAVTSSIDDVAATVSLLQARALNSMFEGDVEAVSAAATEGARLSQESGDLYSREMMLVNLGVATLMAGDLDRSRPLFAEALRIGERIDDRVAQYCLLDALGCCAVGAGQARLAAQLLGAAETVRTEAGATLIATLAPLVAQAEHSAIVALGAARFEAEFTAGKGLRRDIAIRLALGEPDPAAAAASEDGRVAPLGKREADVARLVADGLSNKQIGARLFISERTVDSHVRSILNKLGFNSRAQIAGWMAASKP
jgi:DNA-binding CsgD family transcriptional regulator